MAIRARSQEGARATPTTPAPYIIPPGRLEVTPRVIAKIAATAVRNTEGVTGPAALIDEGSLNTPSWWPFSGNGNGISARVRGDRAALKVSIETQYGIAIPQLADEVRSNIRERVAQIAGVDVQRVDVKIIDTETPEDYREQAITESAEK